MRLGICTSPDRLAAAREAGFAYAELSCATLRYDLGESDAAHTLQTLREAPLPIEAFNVFLPPTLKVTGPAVDETAVESHMDRVLRRAASVGASIVVFGSGGARRVPEGFPLEEAQAQFVRAARRAAEIADRYGLTIALEPLYKRSCNWFNRTDQGLALVRTVSHPRLRLLTDLFHLEREEEPFEHLVEAGPMLAHIHLPTPPLPDVAWGEAGVFDFGGFFSALRRAGYQGRLSVEDNNGVLANSTLPAVEAFKQIREWIEARGGA